MHETMKRSKLKNKANKTKNASDKKNYKKLISVLCSQAKLEYFNSFDSSQGSKLLRVNCNPYFSNEHSKADTDIIQ